MRNFARSIAILFAFLLSPFPAGLFALSDFYWESPVPFTAASARFPVSAFSGDAAAVAWQESTSAEGGEGGSIR